MREWAIRGTQLLSITNLTQQVGILVRQFFTFNVFIAKDGKMVRVSRNSWLTGLIPLLLLGLETGAAQTRVDIEAAVPIGGIQQWITAHGSDSADPILLFLHGGPGNSVMGYADRITGQLQEHFIVVHWDQRAAGKTAELDSAITPMTVELMTADAIEMINYLKDRFSKDKVYLMGHSWGGFLALSVASVAPDLLYACIPVSPMVHQSESDRRALDRMLTMASDRNNRQAVEELEQVKIPFQDAYDLYYHRGWLSKLDGQTFPSYDIIENWARRWLTLYREACEVNFFETTPELSCPLYVFVGTADYQTNYVLTTDYFNFVKAPVKRLFLFEGVGHSVPFRQPGRLQQTVVSEILTN